jgi:hypothetical protein
MPLQMIGQNGYDYNENNLVDSHELSRELRELYDLPLITTDEAIITPVDVITNLNGFLKEYSTTSMMDCGESHLDVKSHRENIS